MKSGFTGRGKRMLTGTALALAAALLAPAAGATAAERAPQTADQQLAFDIYRDIIAYAEKHPPEVAACVHLLTIARALERIGDHSTNVGEMVVYLMTAKIIKHHHDVETGEAGAAA